MNRMQRRIPSSRWKRKRARTRRQRLCENHATMKLNLEQIKSELSSNFDARSRVNLKKTYRDDISIFWKLNKCKHLAI